MIATDGDMKEVGEKLKVTLRAVGSATSLKNNKFKLNGQLTVLEVERSIRKSINYDQSLFLYCGAGFSPTPDQKLCDLFECFQVGGELYISYGFQETWG